MQERENQPFGVIFEKKINLGVQKFRPFTVVYHLVITWKPLNRETDKQQFRLIGTIYGKNRFLYRKVIR